MALAKGFHLTWLMECHRQMQKKTQPTGWIKQTTFFDRLAGTDHLRQQIAEGLTEEQIRESWQEALANYKKIREKYVIYSTFTSSSKEL